MVKFKKRSKDIGENDKNNENVCYYYSNGKIMIGNPT